MNDAKWQRKSAVSLLKQQLQESKKLQEFLELEKCQLKRVVQQLENEWQNDRSRLERDKRKLQKAQQFYAKLCNSKLALKKKLAEKEELREKMKCEVQQLNYEVLSLSNEIHIEKSRVAEIEAACAKEGCVDIDCEMQLLKEVGCQLEQASDEVLIAKERIKRSSQELRYLICQLTETSGKAALVSSEDEAKMQGQKKETITHFHPRLDFSALSHNPDVGESLWTLCQHILGSPDISLQRHRCHKCDLPRNIPEKLTKEVELSNQTEILHGQPRRSPYMKAAAPCFRNLKHVDCKVVPKTANSEPCSPSPTNRRRYICDQATSCDIQCVCSEMLNFSRRDAAINMSRMHISPRDVKPIAEESHDSLQEVKSEGSPFVQTGTTDSQQPPASKVFKRPDGAKMHSNHTTLVAVCDTSLQCSSEPISEQGGGTISPSSCDIPCTYTPMTSPSPRTYLRTVQNNRNKRSPTDDECESVMRTPPLRQPIQLTICQQFYQPIRPICPPASFARTSTSVPAETLFFREPMPPLTIVESPELVDACIGTSPTQSPPSDRKTFTANFLTQQWTNIQVAAADCPIIYQAELACSSDSSRSHVKPNLYESQTSQSPVSPIRGQGWPVSDAQYHIQLDISSSNSDLESIEITEVGTKTISPSTQRSPQASGAQTRQRSPLQLSYNSDVDAV